MRELTTDLPDELVDLQLNDWFRTDNLVENVCAVIDHVTLTTPTTVSLSSTEGSDNCFPPTLRHTF